MCVPLPHLLQQAASPKPRPPAALYLGGTTGEKPKRCLFPGSSSPQKKHGNDFLHSTHSSLSRGQTWLPYLPQPQAKQRSLWHLQLLAVALLSIPEQPSAQHTACSVFLYLTCSFGLLPRLLKGRRGNNFNRLNTSRRGSVEYFQVDTIRTKLTERSRVLICKDRKLLILMLSTKANYSMLQKSTSVGSFSVRLTNNW